jgi:tetratricopeptide (TPR) repeat protein
VDAGESNSATSFRDDFGNVRTALEWSFFQQNDSHLAVTLATFATRFFLDQSLLTECARWSERAILALGISDRGTSYELELQAASGLSLMFTKGNNDQAELALMRALKLSEDLSDFPGELRLLCTLHIFNERLGRFHSALKFAQRTVGVAAEIGNQISIAESHSALGISHHLVGQQDLAHAHLEAALMDLPYKKRSSALRFGFDYRNRAQIALARTLWLRGYPDQAVTTARRTVEEAESLDSPITLCIALIWAVSVYTWCGDMTNSEANIERFCALADRHSLAPYQAVGTGVKGELAVKRGDLENGISLLRRAIRAVRENRYELLTSEFHGALAEGLAAIGRCDEALSVIDEGISTVDVNGDLFMKPELLRLRGNVLASPRTAETGRAEETLRRAIDLARSQGAQGWELRSAASLALVLKKQSRIDEAHDVLAPVFGRFNEGLGTADLLIARGILDELVEKP